MSKISEQEQIRLSKLAKIRESRYPYPNDVKITATTRDVLEADASSEDTENFTVAGRIVQMRMMGKAAFIHILDRYGKLQLYIRQDEVGGESYAEFKDFDLGDIVSVSGYPFVTKTGEQSLHAKSIRLLVKSIVPPPEKWAGLQDIEARYRQRYIDLTANPKVREVFFKRAQIVNEMRAYMNENDFLEVETPVLENAAGGAEARPFKTHHNTLNLDMQLRIALEIPLKKLLVGGLERVYEIGRVFRNEGISTKHNPEFTMFEFQMAYASFKELQNITEEMLVRVIEKVCGTLKIPYGENEVDCSRPWASYSMLESIYEVGGVNRDIDLNTLDGVHKVGEAHNINFEEKDDWGICLADVWDELVEHKLINPTFITHHPFSISPLARPNLENQRVTDRFELIISGMEFVNAYSELNDPIDQRERFETQSAKKDSGKEDAHPYDEDFVRALEVGMPPTGGWGLGIDRFTMLLTNSQSIRDVIFFPQLKPLQR